MADKVKPVPDGYHSITPYLTVPGVLKLIEFLKHAFDAKQTELMMRPDGGVKHAEIRIGDSAVMLGEPTGSWQSSPGTLYLYLADVDAAYGRAIAAGATSLMEPADQFYGDRNAGVQDPSGNRWWLATHIEDVSPEEMQRRAKAAG
jgi:PhnB protein